MRPLVTTALAARTQAIRTITIVIAVCFVAIAWCSGCQRTGYTPTSLPPEFATSGRGHSRSLDLSQLAAEASLGSDLIYPGDVLEVTVTTGLEENPASAWPLRVAEDGSVNVPLVGPVPVAGIELSDAEQVIREAGIRRELYRDPHVSVLLKQRRVNRVQVLGAVENPGVYELPVAGSDLLSALVMAGGFTEQAGTTVELRHPNVSNVPNFPQGPPSSAGQHQLAAYRDASVSGPRAVRVNLVEATAARGGDYHLEDGSVVMVMEEVPQAVHVIGLVRKPDGYELPPDRPLRVLDALALAGGRTLQLADKVHVIRNTPASAQPVVVEVSVGEAKRDGRANLVLAPGDVVSVEETPMTFLVETVRSFVRFGFTSAVPGI